MADPKLLKPGEPPTVWTLRCLWDLLIDVERKLAAGPYDDWDAGVLDEWRTIVRQRITQAESALSRHIEKLERRPETHPEYVVVD